MSQVKPAEFSAVRQPGVLGMALFVWAAFKHASRYVLHTIYSLVARGTVVNASVSFNQISS